MGKQVVAASFVRGWAEAFGRSPPFRDRALSRLTTPGVGVAAIIKQAMDSRQALSWSRNYALSGEDVVARFDLAIKDLLS
jgi:hypothetical protein